MVGRGAWWIRWWIANYAKPNGYALREDRATGLNGVEVLYRVAGDPDARDLIWTKAAFQTFDNFGYYTNQNANSGPRYNAVAIEVINAAHRLGVPYANSPVNSQAIANKQFTSWRQAGEWIIEQTAVRVQANGAVPGRAYMGQSPNGEPYLFAAWLARELLEWHAFVADNPLAYELATRIMGHLHDVWMQQGGGTLPYLDGRAKDSATDLAAFYVWPGLVMWQETGDQKWYDFAIAHLSAIPAAFQTQPKQWNQLYNTGALNAEALINGAPWR
jgi:hypothetical protein